MTDIVRWDAMLEMENLRDTMNRLFESSFTKWPTYSRSRLPHPSVDVVEEKNDVTVTMDVPGFKPENVELNVTDNVLTVRGDATEEKEEVQAKYVLRERSVGSFARSIGLPAKVKPEEAKASFRDGTLVVKLPKAGEAKPRSVQINTD